MDYIKKYEHGQQHKNKGENDDTDEKTVNGDQERISGAQTSGVIGRSLCFGEAYGDDLTLTVKYVNGRADLTTKRQVMLKVV